MEVVDHRCSRWLIPSTVPGASQLFKAVLTGSDNPVKAVKDHVLRGWLRQQGYIQNPKCFNREGSGRVTLVDVNSLSELFEYSNDISICYQYFITTRKINYSDFSSTGPASPISLHLVTTGHYVLVMDKISFNMAHKLITSC